MCDFNLQQFGLTAVEISERTGNPLTLGFDTFVIAISAIILALARKTDKHVLRRYGLIFIGVLIFELFTAPMWNNFHMGIACYIYQDVSWILTMGWSTIILVVTMIVDKRMAEAREIKRFLSYLAGITLVALPFEALLIKLGIRSYSPEVIEATGGLFMPFLEAPWGFLYYVPVFIALVIGFYKYWLLYLSREPLMSGPKTPWLRNLGFSVLAVFLFELMIEPMVSNVGMPSWSYIYRDISILMTGFWVVTIWIVTSLIDRFFRHVSQPRRFVLYLLLGGLLTYPVEAFLIKNGFRVYGPSATANFTGIVTPLTGIPVEVAFAIPFYLALMICFIRYWEIIAENNK